MWDPDYYNRPNGNVDTAIGSELVETVKSRYRTLESPQFWAMGGLSSGGCGAFNIGLRHLENFGIFFSHSGYFTDADDGKANSPQDFIEEIPREQLRNLRAYLDAGEADRDFVASTQQFHETLDRLGVENVFYIFPGGHGIAGADYGWNYFHKHAADSLSYVGEQFQKAGLRETPSSDRSSL